MIAALWTKLRAAADRNLPPHLRDARRGEDLAYRHLKGQGLRVVARNFRTRSGRGEIDLLAWDGRGPEAVLVCAEVKARKNADFGAPEVRVDRAKRRRLVSAAYEYARRAGVDPDRLRFDIISILLSDPPQIRHYPAAFTARSATERHGLG